uniref:Uncharacterized protein n=1 Tax=Rhizophora mucronata TaxID=61149 RepID=A0A2P2M0L9_RHIMU
MVALIISSIFIFWLKRMHAKLEGGPCLSNMTVLCHLFF